MLDIIKSVNDSMHQIAITGFEVATNWEWMYLVYLMLNLYSSHSNNAQTHKPARPDPVQCVLQGLTDT